VLLLALALVGTINPTKASAAAARIAIQTFLRLGFIFFSSEIAITGQLELSRHVKEPPIGNSCNRRSIALSVRNRRYYNKYRIEKQPEQHLRDAGHGQHDDEKARGTCDTRDTRGTFSIP
jgi:hypothetical protein